MTEETATRLTVVQDNALVRAAYTLTLNEKRLLLLVIGRINPEAGLPKPGQVFAYRITVAEWRQRYGTTSKSLYRELEQACERLMARPAMKIYPHGSTRPGLAHWSPLAMLLPDEGAIEIHIYYDLMKWLMGSLPYFTRFDLANVERLQSFYSIRVFELLMLNSHKRGGAFVMPLDEFRQMIDPENKYHRWPDLRRYVIESSISDINTSTDRDCSYESIKTGRKVTAVKFRSKKRSARRGKKHEAQN